MQRTDAWKRIKEDARFIYALIDPRDGRIRYIGSTIDPVSRLESHMSNPHGALFDWILSLRVDGLRATLITLAEADGYFEAVDLEAKYIAEYEQHYGSLLNLCHTEGYGRKSRIEAQGQRWWQGVKAAAIKELKENAPPKRKQKRSIAESLRLKKAAAL